LEKKLFDELDNDNSISCDKNIFPTLSDAAPIDSMAGENLLQIYSLIPFLHICTVPSV